jgi:hypothetical protein
VTTIMPVIAQPEREPDDDQPPEPMDNDQDQSADTSDSRARVQSLAEIRASLQRIKERSRLRSAGAPDDEIPAVPDSDTAAGTPSWLQPRYTGLDDLASADEAAGERGTGRRYRQAPKEASGVADTKSRDEAGLADLLAEALAEYESGRGQDEAPRRRHASDDAGAAESGSALPEPRPFIASAEDDVSPRARHRRPTDPGTGNARSWNFGG